MPEMDGIETTRQIRKRVGNDVTIIILSAYDYSEIEAEAREAGVDEFIAKSLFRSRLTATLKNIIEGKPNKEANIETAENGKEAVEKFANAPDRGDFSSGYRIYGYSYACNEWIRSNGSNPFPQKI